jgi:hypothetical protein
LFRRQPEEPPVTCSPQLGAPGNSGQTQPSRTKYLLHVFGFLLLDLHLDFVDELERDLSPGKKRLPRPDTATQRSLRSCSRAAAD